MICLRPICCALDAWVNFQNRCWTKSLIGISILTVVLCETLFALAFDACLNLELPEA